MNTRLIIEQYKKRTNIVQRIQETKQVQLVGNSMMPILDPSKILVLFVTKDTDYNVGDVVVFKYEHSLVGVSVHRIICKQGNVIMTKGDNNLQSDEYINASDIIGKIEKASMKDSSIVSVNASGFVAKLSKMENRLAKKIPKKIMLIVHRVLMALYRLYAL